MRLRTAIVPLDRAKPIAWSLDVERDLPKFRPRHGEQRDDCDSDRHEHERDAEKEDGQGDRSTEEFGYSISRSHRK